MSEDSNYPEIIKELISSLQLLPGVGRRTAERFAMSMVDWSEQSLEALGKNILELPEKLNYCQECGNFASENLCNICSSNQRNRTQICVVEKPAQIHIIEKTGSFKGLYHVLGGVLKPLDGIGPDELQISQLLERVSETDVEELIFALGFNIESEATVSYLISEIDIPNLKKSRLATGIPAGGDLGFADSETLNAAFSRRHSIN